MIKSFFLALCLLLLPAVTHAVPPRLLEITASMLEGLPRVEASSKIHDKPAHYSGVSLQSLLHSRFYAASGERLRGGWMAAVVRATGADGYQVVFSLAELDESFGGLQVLVADQQNGKPLAPEDGPLRLVVPSDKRGARSLRQLVRLEIVELRE